MIVIRPKFPHPPNRFEPSGQFAFSLSLAIDQTAQRATVGHGVAAATASRAARFRARANPIKPKRTTAVGQRRSASAAGLQPAAASDRSSRSLLALCVLSNCHVRRFYRRSNSSASTFEQNACMRMQIDGSQQTIRACQACWNFETKSNLKFVRLYYVSAGHFEMQTQVAMRRR